MGNSLSSNVPVQEGKKIIFGSVNDDSHPRAGYYHNKNIIKYHTEQIILIPGESSNSFKKLKYGYAKTNKRVFYKGLVIPEANPNTFYVINRENVLSQLGKEYSKLNSVLGISNSNKNNQNNQNNNTKIFYKGVIVLKE